ncbi:DUF983 domain-containing protein [Geminicoccus flavidas]|uniref:DUF983 domain-containing protein n=1 Tax=Geminicoccus flavidas TaxID=2506407 RepID=UPI001F182C8C|nr:DUF983 domain-containing protein [Geminicoccus flavidas]
MGHNHHLVSQPASPLTAGLRGRCLACGEGRLFDGFLSIRPRCEVCGDDLSGQDSGDGPVAFIVLLVGCIVVFGGLFAELARAWPVWLHMLVWLPLTVLLVLAIMRPAKALLIALQYRHRRDDFQQGH